MKLDREPDEVVPHIHDKCQGCPKACLCTMTKKGADQFACVLSFISTAVAHGVSSFDACLSLHNNTASSLVQSWGD